VTAVLCTIHFSFIHADLFWALVLFVGLQVKEIVQFCVTTHHSEFLQFCGILKFLKKFVNFNTVLKFVKFEFSVNNRIAVSCAQ